MPTIPLPTTTTLTTAPTAPTRSAGRTAARWMVTFAGFPLGGLATKILVGPVHDPKTALVGGLLTGTILGAVQAFGLGANSPSNRRWIAATAAGLTVGLLAGAGVARYGTTLGALALQGLVAGAVLGAAQALVLRPRLGRLAFAWPPLLAAFWALGWTVTTSIGVQVDEQFSVFGSSGAVVVTALTTVLPLALRRARTA